MIAVKITKDALLQQPDKLVQFIYGSVNNSEGKQIKELIKSNSELEEFFSDLVTFFVLENKTEEEALSDIQRMHEAKNRLFSK